MSTVVEDFASLPPLTGSRRLPDEIYNTRWVQRVRLRCIVDVRGCWLWQGNKTVNGYGQTNYRGINKRTHRVMFELMRGAIPEGHDVCHTCDVKVCCNPEHLFSGPRQANHDDMWAKGRAWQQKDYCGRGHEYSVYGYTTASRPTWRRCKLCDRILHRIAAGWPVDEAVNTPVMPLGYHRARVPA